MTGQEGVNRRLVPGIARLSYAILLVASPLITACETVEPDMSGTASYWAARLAIMALGVNMRRQGGDPFTHVSVNGGDPVTAESAARSLMAVPKPILCRAEQGGEVLRVNCMGLTGSPFSWLHQDRQDVARSWDEQVRTLASVESSDPVIRVEVHSEAVAMPLSGLKTYLAEYRIHAALTLHRASASARAEGICAVIRVLPEPHGVELHDVRWGPK